MRISFILPNYSVHPTGGAKVVYEYANELASLGHAVSVIHPKVLFRSYKAAGPLRNSFRLLKDFVRYCSAGSVKNIKVSWLKLHPDVVLLSTPSAAERFIPDADVVVATLWRTAECVAKYSPRKGRRHYLVQHYEDWHGDKSRVDATWRLKLTKIVIAKWLVRKGEDLGAEDMHYVPNALDHNSFYMTANVEDRLSVVSMLYSPMAWKGADDGVAALTVAKEKHPELNAVLFGVTPRPDALPQWIEYHQTPSAEFLRDEIYNRSAIYLCPSWSEGWGLPVSEAMACGCAIVSTDNGGVSDFVVDGVNGFIVPIKDASGLAKSICNLLDNRSLRVSMANNNLHSVREFSYSESAKKVLKIFERQVER